MCVTLTDFQVKSPIFLNLFFHYGRMVPVVLYPTVRRVASHQTSQISPKLK